MNVAILYPREPVMVVNRENGVAPCSKRQASSSSSKG